METRCHSVEHYCLEKHTKVRGLIPRPSVSSVHVLPVSTWLRWLLVPLLSPKSLKTMHSGNSELAVGVSASVNGCLFCMWPCNKLATCSAFTPRQLGLAPPASLSARVVVIKKKGWMEVINNPITTVTLYLTACVISFHFAESKKKKRHMSCIHNLPS